MDTIYSKAVENQMETAGVDKEHPLYKKFVEEFSKIPKEQIYSRIASSQKEREIFLRQCKAMKTKNWAVEHSSLVKQQGNSKRKKAKLPSYDECWKHACKSIADGTNLRVKPKVGEIITVTTDEEFCFFGRVSTTMSVRYGNQPITPELYYSAFEKRTFISFSPIWQNNLSHYTGRAFFLYDINYQDIVHIFPMDSATQSNATSLQNLTAVPNMLLDLEDLLKLSTKMKCYAQVTCKTKRNGEIIKPVAIAFLDDVTEEDKKLASAFGVGIIRIIATKPVKFIERDMLCSHDALLQCKTVLEREFKFNPMPMEVLDIW